MKRLLISALATASVLAPLVATPSSASAAVFSARGQVSCSAPGNVEGIWINAGTQSGWASLSAAGGAAKVVSYYKSFGASSYYNVTVGCGGSPSAWRYTEYSPSWNRVPPWPIFTATWMCGGGCIDIEYDIP